MAARTHLNNWKLLLEAIRDDTDLNFQQKVAVLRKTFADSRALFRLMEDRDKAERRFNITISNADIIDEINTVIAQADEDPTATEEP